MVKITNTLVTCLMLLGFVGSVQGALVAYYPFNDGTATDIADGHDGTMAGDATTVTDTPPLVGGTLALVWTETGIGSIFKRPAGGLTPPLVTASRCRSGLKPLPVLKLLFHLHRTMRI